MYIDLLLLFVILLFTFMGYLHGFVRQVLSLLALITIIFFAQPLALWLKYSSGWNWFEKAPNLALWGFSSLSIIILFMLIGGVIAWMRKKPVLDATDHWLGAAMGFLKGFMICLCLAAIYHVIPERNRVRFEDLHPDAKNSFFMRTAEPMLEWKSLATFESLKEIQSYLKNEEIKFKPKFSNAWAEDPGIDSK